MNRITHFGDFGEHHRGAAAYQQVRGVTHRRVRRHAGKRIAAAALHADDQFRGRAGFALAQIQLSQMALSDLQDIIDHRTKAYMLLVLKADDAGAVDRNTLHIVSTFQ